MNNIQPLVAVFMISYNQQDFVIEALDSVLNQNTKFDFRIFLSDDASTDDTEKVIDSYMENHPKSI
ncbi:glycosyltransferase family 2 protein [Epilithonimonas sp.]|uniref:glycosyltransferase family 2 protein n=1 Tax=Epilithonimonas sp. TaxID=2894511 RepID=UPI002FDE25F9